MAIPEMQTAAVLLESGPSPKIEIQQIPVPTPGPNEILVQLTVTSICGTDSTMAAGHFGPVAPILGHEGVGRIAAVGSNAAHLSGGEEPLRVGQRVGIALIRDACGRCRYCIGAGRQPGSETRCVMKSFSGQGADGTFAQYAVVQARYAQVLPERFDGIPDEYVAPVMCGGVTAYKAIKECGLTGGQWLAVVGAGGGVGAFAVAFGKAMGYRVVGLDVGAHKGELALAQGADSYVDVTAAVDGDGVGAEVVRITGGGANAVVVAVGSKAAYETALTLLAPFGTLMCVGLPPPGTVVGFMPIKLVETGTRILGSMVGSRLDVVEALEFVRRGLVTPNVRWGKFQDMAALIAEVGTGKVDGKYVVRLDDIATPA